MCPTKRRGHIWASYQLLVRGNQYKRRQRTDQITLHNVDNISLTTCISQVVQIVYEAQRSTAILKEYVVRWLPIVSSQGHDSVIPRWIVHPLECVDHIVEACIISDAFLGEHRYGIDNS